VLKPVFAGTLFLGVVLLSIAATLFVTGDDRAQVLCCELVALSR
jgi:hypothetical protein